MAYEQAIKGGAENSAAYEFRITGRDVYPVMFRVILALIVLVYGVIWLTTPDFFQAPMIAQMYTVHIPIMLAIVGGFVARAFGLTFEARRTLRRAVEEQKNLWLVRIPNGLEDLPEPFSQQGREITVGFNKLFAKLERLPYVVRFPIIVMLIPSWLQQALTEVYGKLVREEMQQEFDALLERSRLLKEKVRAAQAPVSFI